MAQIGSKRRRTKEDKRASEPHDEDITDPSSNEEVDSVDEGDEGIDSEELDSNDEFEGENPADKRRRLAKQYLENLKEDAKSLLIDDKASLEDQIEEPEEVDDYNNFDARAMDQDLIASRLKEDVAEQQGRVYRFIADRLLLSEAKTSFSRVGETNLTCISCYQPPMNKFSYGEGQTSNKNKGKIYAYTVSKSLQLTKYDITDFNRRPKKLKYTRGGSKFEPKSNFEYENTSEGHYDEILTVAASSDGKYVISGGRDRKLIIWSAESLAPVKVIPTKDRRGEVMSLTFRKNTDQLYAACADFKIRTYSVNQFSQLETLYGHHDLVADISSLSLERCVTVGSRDRTAMLWKIPDETRLTFRGGDDPERLAKKWLREHAEETEDGKLVYPDESQAPTFYGEGSIDVVSMVDDSHFVTGSDNGNICLWSLAKKKPVFTVRLAHGKSPLPDLAKISGENDASSRSRQAEEKRLAHPYWITAIHAIPYSNVFVSGSWNGSINVWKIAENLRQFELLGELPNCKGVVTKIQVVEAGKNNRETFRVLASVGKEHKMGRWISKVPEARNGIYSAVIEQGNF